MPNQTSDKIQVYSLFIQHYKGQLPLSCSRKIEKVINECEECRLIYEDIADFFDEEKTLLYEIMNSDKVNQLKNEAEKLISTENSVKECQEFANRNEVDLENLHCCGA